MAVMTAVGFMAQANAEIRAAQQRHEIDTARRWRLGRPMRVIDELINDLEILNLKRVYRVPLSYESRLFELRVVLDNPCLAPATIRLTLLGEPVPGLRPAAAEPGPRR
ncbi:MAG: hypothetical protein E6J16_10605 [Chloroflexota bacterium]|nr:MAG: hypothetical protein E6J16_10605 [Chloroflexota bacterium]